MTRQDKLEIIYNDIHKDYKGDLNGEKYILFCDGKKGTSMLFLSEMTDADIQLLLRQTQPRRWA